MCAKGIELKKHPVYIWNFLQRGITQKALNMEKTETLEVNRE
jgi:hypothetical protein